MEQLRALQAQMASIVPLTAAQRRTLREQAKVSPEIVDASINVIGAADAVALAVGVPAAEAHRMLDEATRWVAVEGELKATLNGVIGANLVRRQRIALLACQAYNIGRQLARDPGNAALVPHVQEVKRLRKIAGRRKRAAEEADAVEGEGAEE